MYENERYRTICTGVVVVAWLLGFWLLPASTGMDQVALMVINQCIGAMYGLVGAFSIFLFHLFGRKMPGGWFLAGVLDFLFALTWPVTVPLSLLFGLLFIGCYAIGRQRSKRQRQAC